MKLRPIQILALVGMLCSGLALSAMGVGNNPRYTKRYGEALINNVVFSPDSRTIATTAAKKVQLWNARTGRRIRTLHTYTSKPMTLNFSGNGNFLIAGAYGGRKGAYVKIWNMAERGPARNLAKMKSVASVALSYDGAVAAVAGTLPGDKYDASISLWNARTGAKIAVLKKKNSGRYYPQSLIFSRDGKTLLAAIANKERGIEVWNLETRKLRKFIRTRHDVTRIALSADSKNLAAGLHIAGRKGRRSGGIVRIYNYSSLNKRYDLQGAKAHITSLSFHPGGRYLAVGAFSYRPNFVVWDLQTRRTLYKNTKGKRPAMRAVFSPDGKSLAVVLNTYGNLGDPDTLRMYDVGSRAQLSKTGASNDMSTFRVGQRVNAVIKGRRYSGVINRKSKHHYLLKMDNRRPKYWMWVKPGDLRPR